MITRDQLSEFEMSKKLISMPRSMTEWFEECMDNAGYRTRFRLHGSGILHGNPVQLYEIQNVSAEQIRLLLKTYVQTRVNAHEIKASL
jgi:hypothetical protein